MNSMLNITIRVAAAQARREINSVAKEIKRAQSSAGNDIGPASSVAKRFGLTGNAAVGMAKGIDQGLAAMKRFGNALPGVLSKMESTGKNMQWVGRQLSFNFTLPLVAAGAMATKWALDNERAMVRVKKVYGDASYSAQRVKSETDALSKSFEMLSTRFGINQAEVINIAGDWAQAGAAGRGLAEATKLTMEAMIIGEVEATQATEGLIAMMSAYHLRAAPQANQKTSELADQLAKLNAIENQTSIGMDGLIGVIQRAGSAAAVSGISLDQLSGFAAALVPTAGSAAQAGNGLKTMITRLVKPTVETTNMLAKLGLITNSKQWLGANVADRILMISDRLQGLSDSQRLTAEATIAGAWRFNQFAALMNDIQNPLGNYHRALQAIGAEQMANGDSANYLATYQKELATVLNSNPKRFDILTNSIKNSLATAILPMLPAIQSLLGMITGLAQAFADLDPETQKFIMFALMFIAIVGPIVQFMGATILLTKELGAAALWSGKKFFWVAKQFGGLLQNIWDLVARLLFQQGAISSAWATGEGGRAAATATANATILASNTATMGALGAGYVAASAAGTTAAGITGASWTTAAITTEAGWGMAIAAIGSGFMTLGLGAGSWGAATTAAAIAAAGTTGQVWIAANASLVAVSMIAGTEIVTVWIGTAGAIVGVWDLMIAHMMGGYAALGTGSTAGAALTAAPWKLAALEVTATMGTAMTTTAASQAVVPAAALTSATATTGIWATASAAIAKGFAVTFGSLAAIVGLPVWAVVGIIAAAAAAIILILKTDIEEPVWRVIKSIGRAVWALPRIFVAALSALANAVARAVMQIMKWLSYLNPFQRHSPSLVDNVRAGVSTILDEYSRLKAIGPMIKDAAAAHEAFNKAVKQSGHDPQQRERAEQRQIIAEQAPSVLPSFDNMNASADRLQSQLPALKAEINSQAATVARWEAQLKSIDSVLESHQNTLSALEDQLSDVTDEMNKAQSAIDRLGDTDLPGMRAMSDAIFENEMAQKRLRLEMLRMEDAGQSVDDLRDRMAALNGEIDLLRGEREDLRLAGAGSDVLGVYDQEITALEAQRQALESTGDEVAHIQSQLEELARQGEILNLEQSINFDPQVRQIDQMISGLNEMPFDQITSEIGIQQEKLAALQPIHDSLNAKVEAERATVERIQKQRDAIADSLDAEQEKLSDLESAYSDIESQIREMTSAMQEFSSAATAAAGTPGPEELFDTGAGLDFEDVMGTGGLMPEGGLPDIEDFNAQLQKDLENAFGAFDNMKFPDPFGGITEKFEGFLGFVREWGGRLGWIILNVFTLGLPTIIMAITRWGPGIASAAGAAFGKIADGVNWAWQNVIYPVLAAIGGFLMSVFKPVWEAIVAVVKWAWEEVIAPVISFAWSIIQPIFQAIWDFINGYLVPIFQMIAAIAQIVFVAIYKVIAFQIGLAIAILKEIWGFINGDLGPIFTWLWQTIIQPAMEAIGAVISAIWNNIIKPVLSALWSFLKDTLGPIFTWLWQNIVQPAMDGIGSVISTVWNGVVSPIFDAFKEGLGKLGDVFTWLKDKVVGPVMGAIGDIVSRAWDNVAGILETGINFFVKAFNLLAKGVRAVGGVIGVTVKIEDMKEVNLRGGGSKGSGVGAVGGLEAGGRVPPYDLGRQGPFITDGARAIVGEGNPMHPEFVIPTDPKFRGRAAMLYKALGDKIGSGMPMYEDGGIIGAIKRAPGNIVEAGDDVWDATGGKVVSAVRKGAVMAAFAPFLSAANQVIGLIPSKVVRDGATKIKNDLYNWAKGENDKYDAKIAAQEAAQGMSGAGNAAVSGARQANRQIVQDKATGRGWGAGSQWSDLASLVQKESGFNHLAQNPTSTAYGLFQFLNGTWAGTGIAKTSDPGLQTEAGLRYIKSRYGTPSDAWAFHRKNNWYESGGVLNLAQGGLIKHTPGGVLARIGEGRYDEEVSDVGGKVQVLPLDGKGSGGDTYEFYGDLSFPNVTNGDDAQDFLDNLASLAGGGE